MQFYVKASTSTWESIGEDWRYKHYEGVMDIAYPVNSLFKLKEAIKMSLNISVQNASEISIDTLVPLWQN